jgi:aldehyde:ferredoxin oxidoreductase
LKEPSSGIGRFPWVLTRLALFESKRTEEDVMETYGFNGRILRVDLSTRNITEEELSPILYRRYLGGGALSLYFLLNEIKPGVDPLGPDNVLVFAATAVTGHPATGFSRFSVAAKSPLTGGFGESEAGGWWGPELKFAGFDAIIVKGKADKPVYLSVKNGKAEIRDASHIWGQMTREAQETIRKDLGDDKVRVALIGPGGEKLVRYACILNELKHANGRTGLGAVMGAKNLKAIAVRGDKKMALHNPDKVRETVKAIAETWAKSPSTLGELGTARGVMPLNAGGILPTRNFITGAFEQAEAICGETMRDTILVGRGTCYGCPVRCKREVKVEGPHQVDPEYGGPEYETIGALGSLCGIGDLKAIAVGNQICGAYGIDTISTGTTIAFAMECFEKGILTARDTDGIMLKFGNAEAMLRMVEKIARREGFGDLLAEGAKAAAEKIGKDAPKYAMHVKGQPLPLHEPRGKAGLALAYAISPTGADHLEHPHDPVFTTEAGLKSILPLGIIEPLPAVDLSSRKVRMFVYLQDVFSMYNSVGLCILTSAFFGGPISLNAVMDYVNAVTGWDTSLWELMKVGERHSAMARIFNLREGFSAKDDGLPDRLFEPLEGGALQGKRIDPQEFQRALKTYYSMMGWDEKGIPLQSKLEELDLEWAKSLLMPQ